MPTLDLSFRVEALRRAQRESPKKGAFSYLEFALLFLVAQRQLHHPAIAGSPYNTNIPM